MDIYERNMIAPAVGRRVVARCIDLVVASPLVFVPVFLGYSQDNGFTYVSMVLIGATYEILCLALFGRTMGKWIMRMAVENVDGVGRLSLRNAGARTLTLYLVSGLPFGIGLIILWQSIKSDKSGLGRGWHDRASRTHVVSTLASASAPLVGGS